MLFRRVHSPKPHFSFSVFLLLIPFWCGLVNVSKCSELWKMKERFRVNVCSEGSWLPWWDLWKISWHFNKNNDREIIPPISRQNLRQWRYLTFCDCTELWLYRLSSRQCSQSLSIQVSGQWAIFCFLCWAFISLLLGLNSNVIFRTEFKKVLTNRKHSLFPLVSSCGKTIQRDLTWRV